MIEVGVWMALSASGILLQLWALFRWREQTRLSGSPLGRRIARSRALDAAVRIAAFLVSLALGSYFVRFAVHFNASGHFLGAAFGFVLFCFTFNALRQVLLQRALLRDVDVEFTTDGEGSIAVLRSEVERLLTENAELRRRLSGPNPA